MAGVPLRCSEDPCQGSESSSVWGRGLNAFVSLFHLFFTILSRSGSEKFPCIPLPNDKSSTCS